MVGGGAGGFKLLWILCLSFFQQLVTGMGEVGGNAIFCGRRGDGGSSEALGSFFHFLCFWVLGGELDLFFRFWADWGAEGPTGRRFWGDQPLARLVFLPAPGPASPAGAALRRR